MTQETCGKSRTGVLVELLIRKNSDRNAVVLAMRVNSSARPVVIN